MPLAGIVAGDAANDQNAKERRARIDRRQMSWRTVLYGFLRSRRRRSRRDSEHRPLFSDWHHPWLFFLGVGIMIMSVLDAFLTLRLLGFGAIEANPVMRVAIDSDVGAFVAVKLLMTALALFVLIYASRYRLFGRLRVGTMLTALFCAYCALITYELVGLSLLTQFN
ncbi:MAG: DUF5658 family protein [Pseudomonadota bacterium]